MAMLQDGHWTIQDAPPALFHPAGPNSLLGKDSNWSNTPAWQGKLAKAFNGYLTTLSSDRRILLRQYELQDIAFKVVGVGSVGTFCLVMLFIDGQGKPLFLQVKEARAAQNETDCKTFMQACRSGKLEARSDEDMPQIWRRMATRISQEPKLPLC